jgi:hypothetical protein
MLDKVVIYCFSYSCRTFLQLIFDFSIVECLIVSTLYSLQENKKKIIHIKVDLV